MNFKNKDLVYELPKHRMIILGLTIFILLIFLLYQISRLNKEISLIDFLLIPLSIFIAFWFKRFLSQYSNVGFLINKMGLYDLHENLICRISDIQRVDSSPYTFKSANGFIIILKEKTSFQLVPGLYWRLGRRISVGGLISKNESKLLSTAVANFLEKN